MIFAYFLLIALGVSVKAKAQSTTPVNEFVIQQKANVKKTANGSYQTPDKFMAVIIDFVINNGGVGLYPGNKKDKTFGAITGGFIHLKELKPRKGFEREFTVDDIDEKPHNQPTPVHVFIKRQPGKLNYQIIAEFPTHVVFYNAMSYDDYRGF